MAQTGGAHNQGTLFKITTGGTFTLLHSFNNAATPAEGYQPRCQPLRAADGKDRRGERGKG